MITTINTGLPMEKFAVTHALIHVLGKDGISVGHSFHLGDGPCGRHVTALEYELLPCGGVRLYQYSQPEAVAFPYQGLKGPDELKHFIYPATSMTGAASFTLED
ncbi:hypothetical protein vBAspABolek_14 [Aeromonas phage vB_AspA_Bolek]|nr:hypothetical protein vBAspABolek_14 [Aeromonas phage vB_AspA_Bolek]